MVLALRAGQGLRHLGDAAGHCRSFYCLWMTDGGFKPEWKPERSRFVMASTRSAAT